MLSIFLSLRNVCWCGCRGEKGTNQRKIPGRDKEEVKYISDEQGMKLGQRVSAVSNLSLLECTELKGVAGAGAEMVGRGQLRKSLAHDAKKHTLSSRSGTWQRHQWRAGVCSMRNRPQ